MRQPEDTAKSFQVHVFGAHSDSPGFKLKPQPTTGSKGWLQAAVEVYGGPLLTSWLDRELRLAGRLALADGRVVLADTGALLRLPQLAIHLDRDATTCLALPSRTGIKVERVPSVCPGVMCNESVVSPSVSFWPSVATSSRFGLRQVARVPSSKVQSASDMITLALNRSCR